MHDRSPLAAYALGALDTEEAHAVDAHLAGCAECRAELAELNALEALLGEVPPEAFLDGPPEGGDLMLQRTLRRVRAERAQASRPSRLLMAAGTVGLVAAALAGGTLVGRATAPAVQAAPTPTVSSAAPTPTVSSAAPTTPPAGTQVLAGRDPRTGTSLTGVVTPAPGWVRIHVKVEGVPTGVRCRLVVVSKNGAQVQAGSWQVSPLGEQQGTTLDGSAFVPPTEVASVNVVTVDGKKLVAVPV
jgi:hypothetical protein